MSCMNEADSPPPPPAELGLQLAQPGFVQWQLSRVWSLCMTAGYLVTKWNKMCLCSDHCNQVRAHRLRFSYGINPSNSIQLEEHTPATRQQATKSRIEISLWRKSLEDFCTCFQFCVSGVGTQKRNFFQVWFFLLPHQRKMCTYKSQCKTGAFAVRAAFISCTYLNVPIAEQNLSSSPFMMLERQYLFSVSVVSNYASHPHSLDTN